LEKYHNNHPHKPLAFQNQIKVIFRISVTSLFSSVRLKEAITNNFNVAGWDFQPRYMNCEDALKQEGDVRITK
jgi:hypothetical protein